MQHTDTQKVQKDVQNRKQLLILLFANLGYHRDMF